MRSKKGLIPAKVQVPMACGLAVIFVIFLGKNYLKAEDEPEPAAAPSAAAEPASIAEAGAPEAGMDPLVMMGEIYSAISEIERNEISLDRRSELPEPLPGDPFSDPRGELAAAPELIDDEPRLDNEKPEAIEPISPSRAERLANLRVTAVVTVGAKAVSIVNGERYRLGDWVGGFEIIEIAEGGIVLRDGGVAYRIAPGKAPTRHGRRDPFSVFQPEIIDEIIEANGRMIELGD